MRRTAVYDWLAAHRVIVDGAVAAVLLIPSLIVASTQGILGVLWTLFMVPVLTLRRVRPVVTFAVVSLACLLQVVVGVETSLFNVAFPVALYSLAAFSDRRSIRLAGLVVGWIGAVLFGCIAYSDPLEMVVIAGFVAVTMTTVWILGDLVGHRRLVMSRLRQQNIVLARDQSQRERLAAQAERARIAREMHDIVAHNLSVIVVQADGAAYRAGLDPVAAAEHSQDTLQTIATTARSALAETRRLVGVLRADEDEPEYRPTASLQDIEALVGRVVASGLPVALQTRGMPRLVSPETGLAAYRIVQEALTNVMRHAGLGATARVVIDYGQPLGIVVQDNGIGCPQGTSSGGNGLIGMRERVEAVGGSLHAGQGPAGGFTVSAYLADPPRGSTDKGRGA